MDHQEKRWHSEVKAFVGAIAVLVLLCVALIAQALWSTGAMVAILAAGLVVGLAIRYVPTGGRHHPTAH
jgi:hypothetical protein